MRSTPTHADSTGKLLHRLSLLTGDFIYRDGQPVLDSPRQSLLLQPSLARDFSCPSGCTACCLPFTLDFTPSEYRKYKDTWPADVQEEFLELFEKREINVNGSTRTIWSYPQYLDDRCPFLKPVRDDGSLGCSFFPAQPLECASAPQVRMSTRGEKYSTMSKQPFGRAWAWNQTPQCEFTESPMLESDLPEVIDLENEIGLLKRYKVWADLFQIKTVIPEAIKVLKNFREELISNEMRSIEIPLQ